MLLHDRHLFFARTCLTPLIAMAMTTAAVAEADPVPPAPTIPDLAALGVFEKVYVQTTEDGAIHARGSNYKAMFNNAGLTYRPLGGDPMTFTLASATVGNQPLALNTAPLPSRDGDSVSIDRGAFVEHYTLTHNTVEQLFTFQQLPPQGDLVLHIAISAPGMIATSKDDRLEFKNEQTEVTYTKAVLVDAAGAKTSLSTLLNDHVIEIRVSSATLNRASFPITIDPLLSTNTPLSAEQCRRPDVAFDATYNRYLVVAEYEFAPDDGDIYSVMVDSVGVPIANTFNYVDVTTFNWRKPKVANNNIANVFMVVAERGVAPTRGIWGATVDAATGATTSQVELINGGGGEKTNPDIGGDSYLVGPTYFLVVWEWTAAPADHDIAGRLFDATGAPASDHLFLELANTSQTNPAVSKSNRGGHWLVVWQTTFSGTDEDIYGAKVNWNGDITIPSTLINVSGASHIRPQVSSPMGGQYLVAYEESGSIVLHLLSSTMNLLDLKTLEQLGNNVYDEARMQPAVDANGQKFMVVYSEATASMPDWDVYIDIVCTANNTLKLAELHRNVTWIATFDLEAALATSWSGGGPVGDPGMIAYTRIYNNGFGPIGGSAYAAPFTCCPADIAPPGGDGVINVADLLQVLNQWDNQVCPNCSADITGDSYVNVQDLLQVIINWGACQ